MTKIRAKTADFYKKKLRYRYKITIAMIFDIKSNFGLTLKLYKK